MQPDIMIDSPVSPSPGADQRLQLAHDWLAALPAQLGLIAGTLRPASSDASFRRYFRIDTATAAAGSGPASAILMDAPPERENCRPFLDVQARLAARGIHTPGILASDLEAGFLLLTDLGCKTYGDELGAAFALAGTPQAAEGAQRIERLYQDAIACLLRMQQPSPAESGLAPLPDYDAARLLAEMRLFPDWYVGPHLGATLSDGEVAQLEGVFETLVASALAQGRVLVHRDFHSRNLMATPDANPGVLDFQDAVTGPVSYDLVSLLRDAYVAWPEDIQIDWAARYWDGARRAGIPVPSRFDDFWRDLEWIGLQRSLKILGIFARLHHRDGKDRYLGDLPRVLGQAQSVAERYGAFAPLARLLDRLHDRQARVGYTF